jgi:hypothetical protein
MSAPRQTLESPDGLAGQSLGAAPGSEIPCRPWLLSKQYSMTFVLSQDNEILIGDTACKYLGDDVLRHIIAAVNAYSPNVESSATGGAKGTE